MAKQKFTRTIIDLSKEPNNLPPLNKLVMIKVNTQNDKKWYTGYYCYDPYDWKKRGFKIKIYWLGDDTVIVPVSHWCNLPPEFNEK